MKKVLSLLLSLLVVLSVLTPALTVVNAATSRAPDAYATVITASDFQASDGSHFTRFADMINQAKADGADTPSGFIFGGDYTTGSQAIADTIPSVNSVVEDAYPGFDMTQNIYVQGNHDTSYYHASGMYEFEHYWVYVLNCNTTEGYNRNQSHTSGSEARIQNLANDIRSELATRVAEGDNRPVFISSHTPMHHSIRGASDGGVAYGDTMYSGYIFDVLNEYGTQLDIVFLFGHNHSQNFDDYIGGSVNYIAKGETMRVPDHTVSPSATSYTDETLTFTYMNYGYVGYSGNGTTNGSTNALTMGIFEFTNSTIEVARYTASGLYTDAVATIERVNPLTTDPYVDINGETYVQQGGSEFITAKTANIDNPVYTWSSSASDVVEVVGSGKYASVIYRKPGTATITVTASGDGGATATDTLTIEVVGEIVAEVPGDTFTSYDLVEAPESGKKYLIVNRNTAGSGKAFTTGVTGSNDAAAINSATVTVNAADSYVSVPYIRDPDSTAIYTVTESSVVSGSWALKNDSSGLYLTGEWPPSFTSSVTTSSSWEYTDQNYLYDNYASKRRYIRANFNTSSNINNAAPFYFYGEAQHTSESHTEVIPLEYNPTSTLLRNGADVSGNTYEYYETLPGSVIIFGGEFSGFGANSELVTVTWSSSNENAATVENGIVTTTGSGTTEISYTVSDGTTTLTESVTLIISENPKPVPRYALTQTLVAGNEYIIASSMTVGGTHIMLNTSATNNSSTDNTVPATDGTISIVNGTPTIEYDGTAAVYKAIADGDNIHLYNEASGLYLRFGSTGPQLTSTTDYFSDGYNLTIPEGKYHIQSERNTSSNAAAATYDSSTGYFHEATVEELEAGANFYVYAKMPDTASVYIRKGDTQVAGTTQELYLITSSTTDTLTGYYNNFGEVVTEVWSSSNEDVATVDSNGVVSFKGISGEVDITYTVTDTDGNSSSATVHYIASTEIPDPVTTLTKDEVAVDGTTIKVYSVTSSTRDTLVGNYEYFIGDVTEEWISNNGTVASVNNGTVSFTGVSGTVSITYKVSDTNGNSIAKTVTYKAYTTAEGENPEVGISLRYQNVESTTITINNVSPYQTENLTGTASFFPDDDNVNYSWASSDTSVATVDSNGVVTFTGKAGTAVITLTGASAVADLDGNYPTATASVTYNTTIPDVSVTGDEFVYTDTFVDGEYYIFSNADSAGTAYALSNTHITASSKETRLSAVTETVSINADGDAVISCSTDAIVWRAVYSGTDDYFYFINEETGEYLCLYSDYTGTTANMRELTTVSEADKANYPDTAYLIKTGSISAATTESHSVYSSHSYDGYDNALLYQSSSGQWRLSRNVEPVYFYQKTDAGSIDITPVAKIKINGFFEPEDITNTMQSRYEIQNGDTEQLIRYIENFATVSSVNWEVDDESIATIDENGLLTFTGRNGYVDIIMTVTGTDANGNTVTEQVRTTYSISSEAYAPSTEDYPDYPHEGSVRVNKTASNDAGGYNFQTSGVTEVELSVTGVPIPQAVDVVVVFDHSSSMNDESRLENAIANTREFALQLINHNPRNRIAIATFDCYRNIYSNFTSAQPNFSRDPNGTEDRIITGDGTPEGAFVGVDESEQLINQIDSLSTNVISGTNYDYGLQQAYDILAAAQAQRAAGDTTVNETQYVVFMSDGEPYGFNRLVRDNISDDALYNAWCLGQADNETLATYLADPETYPVVDYFNPDGDNWFAAAIKHKKGASIANMPQVDYYNGYNVGLGATVFSIGYGSDSNTASGQAILTNVASSADKFYYAESNLQEAYDSILETIVYAANNAVVTDKIGENYNLQIAPSFTLGNNQATITLDPAPKIEVGAWTLNSDGSRNEYRIIETITFETNENGYLTAAYSSAKGSENIYVTISGDIIGEYVSFNMLDETFTWHIGDITRDEITLKYYAYLAGSAEGEREAGIYDTNEYAVLDYKNYLDHQCQQTFPVPSMGWKQAAVNYEFYLVNADGEPVNKDGIVVPFAERVLVCRPQTKEIYLNTATDYSAYTLVAGEELPEGYELYNPNTSYKVAVSSGDNPSYAVIYDDEPIKTTYFRDGTITHKGDGEVPDVTDYTNTHVSFAVLYEAGIVPDSIVIDYGLPVKISVLANDTNVRNGSLTAIGSSLASGTTLNNTAYTESRLTDGVAAGLVLPNGTAEIEGDKIIYTPTNLEMSTENVFYYEYKTEKGEYYYTTVTVIPAANIYYEESFFTFKDGDGYPWMTAGETLAEKFQAEDRPGTFTFAAADADNVYGRDNAYNDSYTYSLGSSKYTTVDAGAVGKEPTAEFTFRGTGFDLFSVTNSDTGAVLVKIFKTDGKLYKNYIVQTYYGYSYEDDAFKPNPDSTESLYQVPVISARELGYDTYKVVIMPLYSKVFDTKYDETEGAVNSYDIYVDSVRIYNPAGVAPDENGVIGSAYLADGEYVPEYLEIRRNILSANQFYDQALEGTEFGKGSIFIDSIGSLDSTGISDKFLEAGPNNEVYLAKGQAIAFHIVSDTPLALSSVQLGMKLVKTDSAAIESGEAANIVIMNTKDLAYNNIKVSGAHEMYRRLNSAVIWDQDVLSTQGTYQTKYPIIVANTSDSIVSLTEFKWAYSEPLQVESQGLSLAVSSSTPELALLATQKALEDAENPEKPVETPFDDECIALSWSDKNFIDGDIATLSVTTPFEVVGITVDGAEVTECKIDANGNKLWTYAFEVTEVGENIFDVILYDKAGNASNIIQTETITVERKILSTDNVTITWVENTVFEGEKATLNVTTPADIVKVTVDGATVSDCEINADGNKCWTYSFAVTEIGEYTYDVVIYDKKDNYCDPVKTSVLKVEEKPLTADDIEIVWSDTEFKEGKETTLFVTTPADVEKITVDGIEVTEYELNADGTKRWTYTFIVEQSGENSYEILLYDAEGIISEPIKTESITVKEKTLLDRIIEFFIQIIRFIWRVSDEKLY